VKKLFAVLLALTMLFLLAACGRTSNDIKFINKTGTQIHNLYISHTSSDSWGESVNDDFIDPGKVQRYPFPQGDPSIFDIGAINENGLNFDAYDVELRPGDELTMGPCNGDSAILTVKHADGKISEHECYCYFE